MPYEERSRRFYSGTVAPQRSKAEHDCPDYPPTNLGKKTVSFAVGSNNRICET
jgi:hypothetical protein